MDPFSYLSVLISIVLGLGLSHLLAGAAQLVRHRATVRLYAPTLFWMGMLFLLHIQVWWSVFALRRIEAWTFFGFMLVLAIPMMVYLLSYLQVPDKGEVDLRQRYYENRGWFFALLTLLPLLSLAQEYFLWGMLHEAADVGFRLVFAALSAVGLITTSERVHRVLAPAALVAFSAYIALLFRELT